MNNEPVEFRKAFTATIERAQIMTYTAIQLGGGRAGLIRYSDGVIEDFTGADSYESAVNEVLDQIRRSVTSSPDDNIYSRNIVVSNDLVTFLDEGDIPF